MALSLLQDAQTRGLAAALAGMKRDEDRSLTMSPPMANSPSPVYSGIHSAAAASALGMLSPSILAANRTAAALMAARLPMSTLASVSSLFPHHPALFGSWPQPPTMSSSGPHSPPASPISPVINAKKLSHNNNNNNNNNNNLSSNNNNLVSPTIEVPTKKPRKISVKKDLISPPIEIPMSHDIYSSGPISPPSSGSSPNSNTEGPAVHGTSKDPSRDKCFTCKICNRSFGYKHVLQNHERTHTGEKPFECPECHKRFTRDHHLKTHMRLHTGEKPYHCSHCDRQFVQVANLRRHLRVHTGERPYSCDICEARFSDSNQLKSHMLIHNGEKPFECERCHLKFRRRHHLMHHKCGIQSPPTPAISPAMSDVGMSDQKSAISSFAGSDESNDLNNKSSSTILLPSTTSSVPISTTTTVLTKKITTSQQQYNLHQQRLPYDIPLDLSEDGITNATQMNLTTTPDNEKRSRKSTDIRRVLRLPPQILHMPTELPEQTEPEDLSMHSPRSRASLHSPISSHHDDDLEDLDEAATLYLKQRHQQLLQHQQQRFESADLHHRITLKRHLLDQHHHHHQHQKS